MTVDSRCVELAPLYTQRSLGTLDEEALDRIEEHLERCERCPDLVRELEASLEDSLDVVFGELAVRIACEHRAFELLGRHGDSAGNGFAGVLCFGGAARTGYGER